MEANMVRNSHHVTKMESITVLGLYKRGLDVAFSPVAPGLELDALDCAKQLLNAYFNFALDHGITKKFNV
jgi:hypothetical protein